ncbi:MAG: polysaccharide biosynthesis tyrosine autokinase [Alphaproteobacteria bacterium]
MPPTSGKDNNTLVHHPAKDDSQANLPVTENTQTQQILTVPPDKTNALSSILRRRKAMATGISLLCFGISLIAIENIPPLYRANAKIVFPDQAKALIKTQIHYMQSSDFLDNFEKTEAQPITRNKRFKSLTVNSEKKENTPQWLKETKQKETFITPGHLRLSHASGSYVVDLRYYDHNPEKAAQTLNRFISAYISQNEKNAARKKQETAPPADYIETRDKFLSLRSRLTSLIDKQGNIRNNNKALEQLSSAQLETLVEQKKEIEDKQAALSLRYGEKHPKIINIRSRLAEINVQIRQERENLVKTLIEEYTNAKQAYDILERSYRPQRIAATLSSDIANTPVNVQIMERAKIPTNPVYPDKPQLIGLSAIASVLLGLAFPFLIERSRNTILSGNQLLHTFGLPCYALIPEAHAKDMKALADQVLDNPSDTLAEAVRSLRLNIKLKSHGKEREDKVITLTSSHNDEGKTTLCAWLARLAAKSGERVLLIDANLRDPALHTALNRKNMLSLVEYLSCKASLNEVIDESDPSGLHAIYGRSVPNSAMDLLSSDKMTQLLAEARKTYDLIIIDTPPSLLHADARALQPHTDLLLYLVGWNKTKRSVIHKGLLQFQGHANTRTALVLSNIDLKKHVAYGYGEVICEEEI